MSKPTRPIWPAIVAGASILISGCALVPKSRLDNCDRLCQSLRSDNAQLKDVTLRLRSQNQDLAQRGVDDARRIKALDEVNQRLERSVIAYQEERDQISAAFERFRNELQASVDPIPTAMLDKLEGFSKSHPGCGFDALATTATFPAELLFAAGSDEWKPGARDLLKGFADQLAVPEARGLSLEVVGPVPDTSIRRVGIEAPGPDAEPLGRSRAARVREVLIGDSRLDSMRIVVGDNAGAAGEGPPGIAIRLRRPADPTTAAP